jgi:4-amino-4-deoxy-L-arabinose transferase-like glycosyltransferase
LVPVYAIFGHFPGNGIYAIQLCALGSVALVYWLGRKVAGRLCGCLAALFLVSHYGFYQYSHKIMSEVPTVFFMSVILVFLFSSQDRSREFLWRYIGVGFVLGFAVAVRYDNIVALAPVIVSCASWLVIIAVKRLTAVAAGMAPWLLLLALYNHSHFGSCLTTGYSGAGAGHPDIPLFSSSYITREGYVTRSKLPKEAIENVAGNLNFYTASLLSTADTSWLFNDPRFWQGAYEIKRIRQVGALGRTLLVVVGLIACFWWKQHGPAPRIVATSFVTVLPAALAFYLFYRYQEERFLLKLLPWFCLFAGIGLSWIFQTLRQSTPAMSRYTIPCVGAASAALLVVSLSYTPQMGLPFGDNHDFCDVMRRSDSVMESNAVVVSNLGYLRCSFYLFRKTQRTYVPLSGDESTDCQFAAAEEPERLAQLIREGRPAYLLVGNAWTRMPLPEFSILAKHFTIEPLAATAVGTNAPVAFLCRLQLPRT